MVWREKLESSHVFLILGTDHYFESAECFAQAQYAKDLKKPFRILLKKGTVIPDDFIEGVEDVKIVEFTDDTLLRSAKELLGDEEIEFVTGEKNEDDSREVE